MATGLLRRPQPSGVARAAHRRPTGRTVAGGGAEWSCLGVEVLVEGGRTRYRRGPRPGGCESGSSFFGSALGGATATQPRFFMHSSSSVPLMVHAARSRRNSAVVYF